MSIDTHCVLPVRYDDWDEWLPYVTMSYRASMQESTSCTPNQLFLGREVTLPIDLIVGMSRPLKRQYQCETEFVEWVRTTVQESHAYARSRLGTAARRQKAHYDLHSKEHLYDVGTYAWRWYPPAGTGKLSRGWTGPRRIINKASDVNLEIQKLPDSDQ